MSQRFLSGVAAAVMVSTLVAPSAGRANLSSPEPNQAEVEAPQSHTVGQPPAADTVTFTASVLDSGEVQPNVGESPQPLSEPEAEAIKVGTRQVDLIPESTAAIAEIVAHDYNDRAAATLYVQNIPVLTFLETATPTAAAAAAGEYVKVAAVPTPGSAVKRPRSEASQPVASASRLASQLNQLHRDGVDPETITVEWREGDRYVIQLNDEDLIELGDSVMLPDTTENAAQDALQATNRLRRLLGGAEPLREVQGMPAPPVRRAVMASLQRATGMASWYGPGFHGNRSASGEVFDQNALTAAHRTLPFGTLVRVTNTATGQDVIVRINDRGPYSHGRIIDLSAGAARAIGLTRMGVGPVRLDVVNDASGYQ